MRLFLGNLLHKVFACCLPLFFGVGCTELSVRTGAAITQRTGWVLLPMQNFSDSRRAGERAESLLTALLRTEKGVDLKPYPIAAEKTKREGTDSEEVDEVDERLRYEKALAWAQQDKHRYAIGGTVEEWGYRSGTDGEPAVSMTVRVLDLQTGQVVFSASGATAPFAYGPVGGAAQKLLKQLLGPLRIY